MFDHCINRQIRQRRCNHMLAIAQNGGAVGDAGDFVHAVADIDHRHALGFQLAQKGKQAFHIRHSQRGRGFIKDQNLRGLADRLGNFSQLLLASAKGAHHGFGVNLDL